MGQRTPLHSGPMPQISAIYKTRRQVLMRRYQRGA
jgi:hypothetical protein